MTILYVHSAKPLTPLARRKLDIVHGKFRRHFRELMSVSWTMTREGDRWKVRCRVQGRSGLYVASGRADTVADGIDAVDDILLRQRRRKRRLQKTRRHP